LFVSSFSIPNPIYPLPEEPSAFLTNITNGARHPLSELTVFGRKSDSTICLPDTRVSRRHAMIRRQKGGTFWFYDLGSFNGSYINDERVSTTRQLEAHDVIRIGDFNFRYDLESKEPELYTPELAVQTVPMLILVSDVKGFTRLSETIPHEDLARTIGTWYDYCSEVLVDCGAAIDKFIGDAVLAYWTDVSANATKWAVHAARELRSGCDEIRQQFRHTFDKFGAEFSSGVGLHAGDVAWGQFGQGGLTMLGDAVNTTFRVQALTRQMGHDILATGDFFKAWPDGLQYCHPLGVQALKGKDYPVDLFAIETGTSLAPG
jgi:adenylate cyclase